MKAVWSVDSFKFYLCELLLDYRKTGMFDVIAVWKNPKMITYVVFTAIVYPAVMYPFLQYSFFGANADYLRIGVSIPIAFSMLFGPAAAWGAAIGNVIYDAFTNSLNAASYFGFIGNFLLGYIPYKLWTTITNQKPDLRSVKKVGLFMGLAALACILCGLVIGWGLYYLWPASCPFVMTSATIFASDALWAILLGPVILALTYGIVSKHKLLYSDLLKIPPNARWSKTKSLALLVFAVSTVFCFAIPLIFVVDAWPLLPFALLSLVASLIICK